MTTTPITGFLGRRGSGKTLIMTAFLERLVLSNHMMGIHTTVYSTYRIYLPDYLDVEFHMIDKTTFEELFGEKKRAFELRNTIFLFDEIGNFADAYKFTSKMNVRLARFGLQSRKVGNMIMYTTQMMRIVPIRIRDSTEIIIKPVYDKDRDAIDYDVFDYDGEGLYKLSSRTMEKVSYFFDKYDSDEVVDSLE